MKKYCIQYLWSINLFFINKFEKTINNHNTVFWQQLLTFFIALSHTKSNIFWSNKFFHQTFWDKNSADFQFIFPLSTKLFYPFKVFSQRILTGPRQIQAKSCQKFQMRIFLLRLRIYVNGKNNRISFGLVFASSLNEKRKVDLQKGSNLAFYCCQSSGR